jgi:hypothetical protein
LIIMLIWNFINFGIPFVMKQLNDYKRRSLYNKNLMKSDDH